MVMRPSGADTDGGTGRGGDRRKRSAPRSAFTIVEVLAALLIAGILFGGLTLSLKSLFSAGATPESVRQEAERAAGWLQRVFHKALLSRRGFTIRVLSLKAQPRMVVHWVSPVEDEVYDGKGRAFFLNHSASPVYCSYSPKWNTLTPALTVRVVRSEKSYSALRYIVVSPYGRVSLRDTPP